MRQLQLVAHGELSDVIELNRVSEPALGHDDVLVSMKAALIHRTFAGPGHIRLPAPLRRGGHSPERARGLMLLSMVSAP